MKPSTRNIIVWIGVAAVLAVVWFLGAQPRLHFINPIGFLALLVAAAGALTGLLWWELATGGEDADPPAHPRGATPPATGE